MMPRLRSPGHPPSLPARFRCPVRTMPVPSSQRQSLWPRLQLLLLPPLLFLLAVAPLPSSSSSTSHKPCTVCRNIVDQFHKGLANTEKKNFGGGNTAWEEKTLSKYESSEIRLVEIIESLCESDAFECNNMVENQEEHLENWWFKQKKRHPDLFRWFCVDTLRVCCLSGTYGPDCLECPGGAEQPCRGNGYCNGDGSRGGDGKCACHLGYTGALCMDCVDGYFSSWRNDTHSVCTVCHQACKTCTGPSPKDCGECELGWAQQEDACVDVDECAAEAPACEEGFYCLNNNGSFSCQACDASCAGCVGEGPEHCKSCTAGYAQEAGACRDIDECAQPEEACPQEHQKCFNTPGSFVCACAQGFQETDGACVPTPETQEPQEAGPASSSHEDL
ncbi:protein disulfide isomerase CRELD2 isoform X2 [Monodelphis domestica]|uniref:protein disulfide isomerase CRELD2 isoform X2 n=1 Tax=Monodelphis domestica TaxID=13616 RepID=UPI00044367A0|nr:protein disulfide isomerase CRELD2 isoform X2 [Monodelphis domestica]